MKYVVALGFVAILLVAYAYTSLFSVTDDAATENSAVEVDTSESVSSDRALPLSGTNTLTSLQARGADLECTIIYESEEQGEVEGTLFVSDGSLRGDFLVDAPDLSSKMVSSMIVADGQMEVWTDWQGTAQGVRIELSELDNQNTNEPVALDDQVAYECTEWSPVDRSVFQVPGDVLFYDLDDVIEAGPEYGVIYEEEAPVLE